MKRALRRLLRRLRRNPYRQFAGDLTGVYPPGYLDELRDEWDR